VKFDFVIRRGKLIHFNYRGYGSYNPRLVGLTYSGLTLFGGSCHHSSKARRLDHNSSNLSAPIGVKHILSHDEIVKRAANGELGNTEVKANQIW
jgi:hypothetical protein